MLTSSSTLTLDFLKDNIIKNMSGKTQLLTLRLLVVFFIAVSVVIALDPPDFIAQLMGISWGALAGAFLAPFLYGLYGKWVTRKAVWASFIAGVGITVSNMFFHFIASPINAGAAAMVAGLIIVPLVSLFTQNPYCATIDATFACYEEKVVVPKKVALSYGIEGESPEKMCIRDRVPVDSPLAQAGAVYYNTLLDENASCHLALGDSFPLALAADAPAEERAKLNQSDKHVDFMIGSDGLDIRGIQADGREVMIFRRGLWAF